jgi:hypothetical protein
MATLKNTTLSDTGFIRLPVGTTGQRPSPAAGQFRYNTTTGAVEIYTAGANIWQTAAARGVRATGGTVYDVDVEGTTYRVHVFTATGNSTFTVTRPGRVEYLIVAGGGGGSGNFYDDGAGGGAGGLILGSTSVTPQAYTITVGGGGARSSGGSGGGGGNSVALGLTALGGGGGASHRSPGNSGGSGGGGGGSFVGDNLNNAGGAATQPGSASGGFGNRGANGGIGDVAINGGGYPGSGGGGGAGSIGGAPTGDGANQGGRGGIGINTVISGISTFYAGGGGGLRNGIGGIGGGATASFGRGGSPALDATPNTGGGGGGGRAHSGETGIPSNGGSGIVVIRYPLQSEPDVVQPKVAGDGLVLDLDFAKPTVYAGSGTVVTDSRLNGLTGTINGSVPFINGRTNRSAMSFDLNASNNILLSNSAIPTGNFITIVIWNFGKTLNQSSIISGTNPGGLTTQDLNIHLPWSDGNVYWDVGDPFGRLNVNVSAIYQGWHHWVFTHNATAGTKRIYHDGTEIASNTGQTMTIPAMTTVRIGAYVSLSYGHNGDIASLSIYNRELSSTEVSNNFNVTRWRFGV